MDRIERLRDRLNEGMVIPAHPLALASDRKLDERHQRALTRYYLAAGAGGLAVGVHTTQFAIHRAEVGLYRPVLQLAAEVAGQEVSQGGDLPVLVAGLVGPTAQAVKEAELAVELGFDCGLLSLGALRDASDPELVAHARAVAEVIPLFGFYLQPAVGGRILGPRFWRDFVEIEPVVAIKIAPFNRYFTLDVIRAVAQSGRVGEIALYTGNDDTIISDLATPFSVRAGGERASIHIVGGLLGHWAVWTRSAVDVFLEVRKKVRAGLPIPQELLSLGAQMTDMNAAIFDPANSFAGCIAGIHEVLARQGLLQGRWTLDPDEDLSPGQLEEISRVCADYPHLTDDDFVKKHLDQWLAN